MNDNNIKKNMSSDEKEKPLNELPPMNQLAVLIVYLLEYFEAGGLSEEESKDIFDTFMECIGNMKEESHEMLVDRIIEKWALPLIKPKGNS
jgi:hypothetical protein